MIMSSIFQMTTMWTLLLKVKSKFLFRTIISVRTKLCLFLKLLDF